MSKNKKKSAAAALASAKNKGASGPKKVIKKSAKKPKRTDTEKRLGRFSAKLARNKYKFIERMGNEHRRVVSNSAVEDIVQLSVEYARFVATVAHKFLLIDRKKTYLAGHVMKAIVALPVHADFMSAVLTRATEYMNTSKERSSDKSTHGRHGTKTCTHARSILLSSVIDAKSTRSTKAKDDDDNEEKKKAAFSGLVRVSTEAALVLAALMDVAVEFVFDAAVAPDVNGDLSQKKLVNAVGEVRQKYGVFHNVMMEVEVDCRAIPERLQENDKRNMQAIRAKKKKTGSVKKAKTKKDKKTKKGKKEEESEKGLSDMSQPSDGEEADE